jgi:hypothetical protein
MPDAMKVKDLIAALQQFDPDDMVVVNGYEGGLDEVRRVYGLRVKINYHRSEYFGPHEPNDSGNANVVYVGKSNVGEI